MAGTNELRIVLLGKTGLGKSSSGNTILNENRFRVSISPRSVTRETQMETTNINGRDVTVIDTPGFLNTEITEEQLRRALVSCIVECAPGPHAFLIVLKVQQYTEEERKAIQEIKEVYGENVLRYAVVLFTHADQLRKHKKSIKEFVEEDEDLKKLIGECGGRYHAFNNDEMEDRTQVEELLRKIDAMVMKNGGGCYTNEMLQAVPRIHNREDRCRFIDKLLRALAGVGTGAILGAFYGVKLSCKAVVVLSGAVLERAYREVFEYEDDKVSEVISIILKVASASAAVVGLASVSGTTVLPTVGVAAGVGLSCMAVAGGVVGGAEGFSAAKDAESVRDAHEKAWNAVTKKASTIDKEIDSLAYNIANI